jgi:anaerobic selenocysteine-containing dehydrogenase
VYEDDDIYRGQDRRDVVLMNKSDMENMGFEKDECVLIKSNIGEIKNILARPFNIKQGAVLMYYPEVNSLIGRDVDPLSQTPGFKSALVTITAFS